VTVVLQRAESARVVVDGEVVGEIGKGLLLLLGVAEGDTEADCDSLARKIATLRVFEGPGGKLDISVQDEPGATGVLVVPNFTLCANMRRGRRPDFSPAAPPGLAEPMFERFVAQMQAAGVPTAKGVFGAHMHVELLNDGPVTLVLRSEGR